MSLKWFHLFFISLSIVMSVAVGLWGLFNDSAVLGAGSLAGAVGLGIYGSYFIQKARKLGLVALMVAAVAEPALACPVCFGASDAPAIQGMQMAIIALLIVTAAVLGGFAAFFVVLMRRARLFGESSAGIQPRAHGGSF
jgi:hypothetical protein